MLRQEERIGLLLRADREKLAAIDRLLTGTDSQQGARSQKTGPEDYRLFTIAGAARKLRVSRPTVYRWIGEGSLRAFRVGKRWRISVSAMRELQEKGPEGKVV